MPGQMFRLLDTQQEAGQSGIQKIEFGTLDQPLVDVGVPRPQQGDNPADL
jgi:hypothetical protein